MEFLDFLKTAKTAYHAVNNFSKMLDGSGFIKLEESSSWKLEKGFKYYFTRNNATIIAFSIPNNLDDYAFNITATHSDSPTFKLKPNFKYLKGEYNMLNTEVYGGPIFSTWMDRPLDISGRVIINDEDKIKSKLISFDKPMAIIPNSSIHYYPELNTGVKLNPQVDLIPLFSLDKDKDLLDLISDKLGINKENILGYDLFLSLLDRGMIGGAEDEFIFAPQIDNLELSHALINTFKDLDVNDKNINLAVVFDNEEIGSLTREGAGSTILAYTLERISDVLGKTKEEHQKALASSFLISADNAQGFHPNYPGNYDPTNAPMMSKGIVIKSAARGSYTTDGFSLAYFRYICNKANALYQFNTNRSDKRGGGTLGAISLSHVSIPSVDIGLPQIAMHSAYETAAVNDYYEVVKAFKEFYKSYRTLEKDSLYNLK